MADENTESTGSETEPDGRNDQPEPAKPSELPVPPAVARALRQANKEAETLRLKLKEIEDRDKSEAQKLAEAKTAAEKAAADAQHELLRYKVAAAKKLPAELAERLRGATEAELTADADALLKLVGAQAPPDFDGGARTTAKTNDMNALIRQAAGVG